MKVILNSDVDKLGHKGDVVEVAPGFARNFLLPQKLAMTATRGSLKQAESMSRARNERDKKEKVLFEELARKITGVELEVVERAGDDGQLFGSVTTGDIAEQLNKALGEDVDKRKLVLEQPIKSLGLHDFSVHLRADVVAHGRIQVTSTTGVKAPPVPEEPEAVAPADEADAGAAATPEEAAATPEAAAGLESEGLE